MSTVPLATHQHDAPRIPTEFDPGTRLLPQPDAFASMVYRQLFVSGCRSIDTELHIINLDFVNRNRRLLFIRPSASSAISRKGGPVRTLLDDVHNVRGAEMGKVDDGWTVLNIEPRRLILGHDGEILE